MSRVSVEVPGELVEPVRETVLLLYQATAESLHQALRAGDAAEARSHRLRVDELDDVVRTLAGGGVRLTGSREVIHDVLYGALIDAGERLSELSSDAWRGQISPQRIQEAAGEVLSLHSLLGGLGPDSPCR
jgi:hypothetical protein